MEKRKSAFHAHRNTSDAETAIITHITAALMAEPPRQITIIEASHDEDTDTVILAGEVENHQTREAVERIAAQYPGVSAVVNTLAIGPRRLPPPTDEAQHAEYDIHVASVSENAWDESGFSK
jgi:NAD(P)-dependent dehydrogenase (short-subunit alcohol dehydrogenase family)